jgi:ATP-binding protein involved in chromosome partitioning
MVENMAYYRHPVTEEKLEMFPRGELQSYLEKEKLKLLSSFPFDSRLAKASEIGIPLLESSPGDIISKEFLALASMVVSQIPAL